MTDLSPGVVAGLGMTIVFSGLVFLVFIVWLMGVLVNAFTKKEAPAPQVQTPVSTPTPVQAAQPLPIENREALIAAISACLAEELGTDVSAISIQSFRRI